MKARSVLLATLLLSTPFLLAPAQGVEVAYALCEGPLCLAATTDGGQTAADACVEGATCGSVTACLRDVDCVALAACADGLGVPCVDARNCRHGEEGRACAVVPPCPEVAPTDKATAPALPVDCIPRPPVLGWNACADGQTEFTLRVFTGLGLNGQGSSAGTWDSLWRTTAYPPADWQPATLSGPAYSRGLQPVLSYVTDPASSWINPYATSDYGPGGQYVFEANYLVPANAWGVTLSGRYAVDNNALVSDTDASLSLLLSTSALDAFSFWTPLPTVSLSTGLHTLTVNVNNRHAQSQVGANVQATIHGYCQPVVGLDACKGDAERFRIVLNTGLDAFYAPQPSGQVDAHWTATGPSPAYSLGQDPLPGTWVTDPASSWIGDLSETTELPDDPLDRVLVVGTDVYFGYQIVYHLPPNAYNVWVNGKAAADNNAVLADTDAWQSTYVATTPDPYGFASWTTFSYPVSTLGFRTFSASVVNHEGPTGLNVVAEVTGSCAKIIELPDDVKDVLPSGALP